jgi:hypothetical protein
MEAAASSAEIDLVTVNGPEARKVSTTWHNWAAQVVRSDLGLREQVDACRQVLLWQPDLVSWAVVGTAIDPDVYAKAVHDFGPVLVTHQTADEFGIGA